MSSSYRMELDKWLRQLDVKADRVLDIGGSQVSLKPRVKSWDVKELLVADLPNPHEDSPKPDIELDLNNPLIKYAWGQFDAIFCLEVFDYVWNPYYAFEGISKLLTDGGTAWISFPSVYPLHQPIEDDALRYMPAGVTKLAEATELTVKKIIYRRPESQLWEQFFSTERMRAAKHEDHHFTGLIVEFEK